MINSPQETSRQFYKALAESKFISAVFEENRSFISINEYVNFDENPDELFLAPEFGILWASITPLVEQGLQHCQYSLDEQKEMFAASKATVVEEFKSNGLDKLQRVYDANLDLKISQLFFSFTNSLMQNPKPITASQDLFIPLLKQLQRMQDYLNSTNLLQAVFSTVSSLYGEDLAKACLPQYLIKAEYFRRPQKQWQKAVLNQITEIISDANLTVIIPLLLISKEENYWEFNLEKERELAATKHIIRVYEDYMRELPLINREAEQCLGQIQKLHYITDAISNYTIESSEYNGKFLWRIIGRFNETEPLPLPDSYTQKI
jgi:hypothetical protein